MATAKKSKKAPAKASSPATKKKTAKKATKKTTARKSAPKAPAKKAAKKKAPAKKAPAKKAPAKKAAAAKSAPAKKTAKKAAKKKAPAKKAAAKKAPTSKAAAKRAAAAKAAEEQAARNAAARKANVGQTPRRTESAASIPLPTHQPPREAPAADETASQNKEASGAAKSDFKVRDKIVYPAHGVGEIKALEKQEVAGIKIELFVIDFEQEKMKLRVPTSKAKAAGMRPLSSTEVIDKSIVILHGRPRIKRTMWSRRAQEYEAKINSGEIKLVAEVVRDLFRDSEQPEQSYSERQLFEAALDRMAREVAAVRKASLDKAIEELETALRNKTKT